MTRNFLVLFFVLLGVGCTPQCEKYNFEPTKPIGNPLPEFKIESLSTGQGPKIKPGDIIAVHYRAWIFDNNRSDKKGAMVSDTYNNGTPLKIHFGETELIEGWQEGLQGIKNGGKRRLFIPSTMAYGNEGAGSTIPKGAHLIYEIEVVSLVSSEFKDSSEAPKSPKD